MFYIDGRDIVAGGTWDRIHKIAGDLLVETDLYPPRFRFREFPTEDQLAAIGMEQP